MDEFEVEAVSLKKLKKIKIGHNSKSAGDGWFLDRVEIIDPDDDSMSTKFECNRYGLDIMNLL